MFIRGYNAKNIGSCVKTFLNKNKSYQFNDKPFAYIVRLNDKLKIGACNNLYNRMGTYNAMYRDVELLNVRGFPTDLSGQVKYNKIFASRVARINGNQYHHDIANEVTILKSVKDLTDGKHNILDMDFKN